MSDYGFSEIERKIIMAQIERRAKHRKEFLRLRTDPCKQSMEAGHVFDPAIQRYLSMKATQLEFFQVNLNTIRFGVLALIVPLCTMGYAIWTQRTNLEKEIRCGRIRYRDRLFKFK